MNELDEVVQEFLVESYENLDQLERDLVALEENPTAKSTLASIFRTIHTIKGTCGFLGFSILESVSHAGENLLSKLRDGELLVDAEITTALLALDDAVRRMLGAIEQTGAEGEQDFESLVAELVRLQSPRPAHAGAAGGPAEAQPVAAQLAAAPPAAAPPAAAPAASGLDSAGLDPGSEAHAARPGTQPADGESSPDPGRPEVPTIDPTSVETPPSVPPEPQRLGEILVQAGKVRPDDVQVAAWEQEVAEDTRPIGEILVEQTSLEPKEVADALQTQGEQRASSVSETSIRVEVGLLDQLMTLVSELVLARNQILQLTSDLDDHAFGGTSKHLTSSPPSFRKQ